MTAIEEHFEIAKVAGYVGAGLVAFCVIVILVILITDNHNKKK